MLEQTSSPVYNFPVSSKENCCPYDSKEGRFANHPKDFLASCSTPSLRAVWEGKDRGEGDCGGGKGA